MTDREKLLNDLQDGCAILCRDMPESKMFIMMNKLITLMEKARGECHYITGRELSEVVENVKSILKRINRVTEK